MIKFCIHLLYNIYPLCMVMVDQRPVAVRSMLEKIIVSKIIDQNWKKGTEGVRFMLWFFLFQIEFSEYMHTWLEKIQNENRFRIGKGAFLEWVDLTTSARLEEFYTKKNTVGTPI